MYVFGVSSRFVWEIHSSRGVCCWNFRGLLEEKTFEPRPGILECGLDGFKLRDVAANGLEKDLEDTTASFLGSSVVFCEMLYLISVAWALDTASSVATAGQTRST